MTPKHNKFNDPRNFVDPQYFTRQNRRIRTSKRLGVLILVAGFSGVFLGAVCAFKLNGANLTYAALSIFVPIPVLWIASEVTNHLFERAENAKLELQLGRDRYEQMEGSVVSADGSKVLYDHWALYPEFSRAHIKLIAQMVDAGLPLECTKDGNFLVIGETFQQVTLTYSPIRDGIIGYYDNNAPITRYVTPAPRTVPEGKWGAPLQGPGPLVAQQINPYHPDKKIHLTTVIQALVKQREDARSEPHPEYVAQWGEDFCHPC